MKITPDQALAEAANMALELRLKDRALTAYEREIADLRARNALLAAKVEACEAHHPKTPEPGGTAGCPARRPSGGSQSAKPT